MELEIVDRKSVVDSMARAVGLFKEHEEAKASNLADMIREGVERVRRHSATYDADSREVSEG